MFKIALILKEHFREIIDSYLPNKPDDIIMDFYSYQTNKELLDTFLAIRDQYDGFYVSGIIPKQIIRSLGEVSKDALVASAVINVEYPYQVLLRHIITKGNEHVDLSRVGMDFISDGKTLVELIRNEEFAHALYTYEQYWSSLTTFEEIEQEEQRVQDYYVKQCQEGRLDLIITYYYSVLERVKDFGVECRYIYRNEMSFWNSIQELTNSISIQKFNKNRSAVIHINTDKIRELYPEEYELYRLNLVRTVVQFNQQNFNRAIFKSNHNDLELYMDYGTLELLTDGFQTCPLLPVLKEKLDFAGAIGYGIGDNIYQARLNAVNASCYSKSRKREQPGSYLMNQNEDLLFLTAKGSKELPTPAFSIQADSIAAIADKVRLSSETILRIAEAVNSLGINEITSQDLIHSLGISLRTANKFLSHLEKGGFASVCGQKRLTGKGRPVNIYRISF